MHEIGEVLADAEKFNEQIKKPSWPFFRDYMWAGTSEPGKVI